VSNYVKYFTRTNSLIGSAALTYNVIPELTLKSFIALDYRMTQDHRYQDPRVNDAFAVSGRLSENEDWNTNYLTTTTASYRKTLKDVHNISALLGIEYRHDQNQFIEADVQG